LAKALKYAMARQVCLQVFLSDADVPIDTNHLERGLRVIPMGKNYPQLVVMEGWRDRSSRDHCFSRLTC